MGAVLCQRTAAFGRISSSTSICSRCSHLESWTLLLCPRIFQLWFGVWVLPVEYCVLDFSGDPACYLVRQWRHVLREAIFSHFLRCGELESRGVSPPFTQNGERAQSMLLVVVALSAVRTLTLDIISKALQMAVGGNFRCVVQAFFGPLDDASSRAHANSYPSDVAMDTVV